MNKITITVDVDGNAVSREYTIEATGEYEWGVRVLNMLDTIEKSNEPMKEIPIFEGTLKDLNNL